MPPNSLQKTLNHPSFPVLSQLMMLQLNIGAWAQGTHQVVHNGGSHYEAMALPENIYPSFHKISEIVNMHEEKAFDTNIKW